MIICQELQLGFVHIPKAAGSSIRRAMIKHLPHCYHEPLGHFHKFGVEIRDWVLGSEAFERLRWFAVTRHPVESIYSSYQRTMQIAREGNLQRWHQLYRTYLETTLACRDFEEYAAPGGSQITTWGSSEADSGPCTVAIGTGCCCL